MNYIIYNIKTNVLHENMVESKLRFIHTPPYVYNSNYDIDTFLTVNDSIKNSIRKKYQ